MNERDEAVDVTCKPRVAIPEDRRRTVEDRICTLHHIANTLQLIADTEYDCGREEGDSNQPTHPGRRRFAVGRSSAPAPNRTAFARTTRAFPRASTARESLGQHGAASNPRAALAVKYVECVQRIAGFPPIAEVSDFMGQCGIVGDVVDDGLHGFTSG